MTDPSDDIDVPVTRDLAAAYSELQNLMIDRPDVAEFLQQAALLASTVLPDTSCGITMRRDHELETVANSDDFALAVDEVQYGRGQGPCLHSLRTGEQIHVTDLATDERWDDYRVHALTYGARSSLSLPLSVDGGTRGALNLYATTPDRFTADDIRRAQAFTRQTAAVLAVVLRNADQIQLEAQLREALATRAVIDQAIGIVMGQRRVNAHEAFATLRDVSQTRNRKLRDVAADLIETVTGEPPKPPRPFVGPR